MKYTRSPRRYTTITQWSPKRLTLQDITRFMEALQSFSRVLDLMKSHEKYIPPQYMPPTRDLGGPYRDGNYRWN